MIPRFVYLCLFMLVSTLTVNADDDSPRVAFADNFSTARNFSVIQTNEVRDESGSQPTRLLYPFVSENVAGKLTVIAKEDFTREGPDGKPGVLSFQIAQLPHSAAYCGLTYLGRHNRRIRLPGFNEPTEELLERTRVSFRYKCATEVEGGKTSWRFRFEPDVDSSYDARIDFDTIEATDQWKRFDSRLSDGENTRAFVVAALKAEADVFKFVWGQVGLITEYNEGDTLLIDDVRVTIDRRD